MQIPGYLENADELKARGVDEVIVFCVNDGAVMAAWAKDQQVPEEGLITLMGDPSGQLTQELDIVMKHPGPESVGLFNRCKRTAIYAEDGVVKVFRVSEKEDDPAGDAFPEDTCAPSMLQAVESLYAGMPDARGKTEL